MNVLPILMSVSLLACGSMKTVPVSALAEVPTSSVPELAQMEASIAQANRALAEVERRHAEVERSSRSADVAVARATTDMDGAKMNRGEAVSEGDVATAGALATDVDLATSTVARRTARADVQSTRLELLAQGVEVRKAERDAAMARLELARAQAAAKGGADVKVDKYERQSDAFDTRLAREVSTLRALEVSLQTELEPNAAVPADSADR